MSGVIRVRDSRSIDYETNSQMKLVVVAQADGSTGPQLYGYTQVLINLIDQNDNTPKFTQQQYTAVVWEGNNKGTFVMQVSHLLKISFLLFYNYLQNVRNLNKAVMEQSLLDHFNSFYPSKQIVLQTLFYLVSVYVAYIIGSCY